MLLLAVALAASPPANLTYLACVLHDDKGDTQISLVADEQAQTVTTTVVSTGFSERLPALFSPTAVRFKSRLGGIGSIESEVSRTDLSLTRSIVIGSQPSYTRHGTCRVEEPPKRAF